MRLINIVSLLVLLVSTHGFCQSKLGFEFVFNGYSNSVSVPRLMSYVTSMASGSGTSTYYGLTLTASEKITLRSGVAYWNMPFSPTFKGTVGLVIYKFIPGQLHHGFWQRDHHHQVG